MLWLRLCMRKEAKWFKNQDQGSNQTFVEYKSANLQWYDLLEGLDDSQDQELKESLLMHLKLRFKTAQAPKFYSCIFETLSSLLTSVVKITVVQQFHSGFLYF